MLRTPGASESWVRLFLLVAWAVLTAADFCFVAKYGRNVPFEDDWEIVPTLTGHRPLTLDWLWDQHNEHRIPVPRLILLALDHQSHGDFRAGMFFNVAVLSLLALAMLHAARQVRGRAHVADLFFPLVLLHWGHAGNLLWSWQVAFITSTALAGLILVLIVRENASPSWRCCLGAGTCLFLLPLCGGPGVALAPALALWFLFAGFRELRSQGANLYKTAVLLPAGLLAFLEVALYFWDFHPPAHSESSGPPANPLLIALQFMSMSTGWVVKSWWGLWGTGMLVLLVASGWILSRRCVRLPDERVRTAGLLLFLAAMLSLALAIGWGRAAVSPTIGLSIRYITLAAPLICCIYLVFVVEGGRWGELGQEVLALVAVGMMFLNMPNGWTYGRDLSKHLEHFQHDLEAGVPRFILAEHYARYPFDFYSNRRDLAGMLTMLQEAGIEPYRHMASDPDCRMLPATEEVVRKPEANVFVLRHPQFVAALRLSYAFQQPQGRTAPFQVTWKELVPGGPPVERVQTFVLPQETHSDVLTVWVHARVSEFTLHSLVPCTVSGVELLVPR